MLDCCTEPTDPDDAELGSVRVASVDRQRWWNRYDAVRQVSAGSPIEEIAALCGASHSWCTPDGSASSRKTARTS